MCTNVFTLAFYHSDLKFPRTTGYRVRIWLSSSSSPISISLCHSCSKKEAWSTAFNHKIMKSSPHKDKFLCCSIYQLHHKGCFKDKSIWYAVSLTTSIHLILLQRDGSFIFCPIGFWKQSLQKNQPLYFCHLTALESTATPSIWPKIKMPSCLKTKPAHSILVVSSKLRNKLTYNSIVIYKRCFHFSRNSSSKILATLSPA